MPLERVEILTVAGTDRANRILEQHYGLAYVQHIERADGSSDTWVVLPVFTTVEERATRPASPAPVDVFAFVEQQLKVAGETGEPFRLEPWQRTLLERYVDGR